MSRELRPADLARGVLAIAAAVGVAALAGCASDAADQDAADASAGDGDTAGGDGDDTSSPAPDGSDAGAAADADAGGMHGSAQPPDRPTHTQGRNGDEVVLDGQLFHPLGLDLTARLSVPEGGGPHPTCLVLHGSGGLFREGDLGDECSEAIEGNFAAIAERLAAAGVAVLMPSSFYSRDPRFCEDNSEFIEYAPAAYDRGKKRTALRLYDLLAAVDFVCARPELDCERMCFVGTSNGASIVAHSLHRELDTSFGEFFESDGPELEPVPYHAVPAGRALPSFGMAISPGCGFQGAIPFETDAVDLPTAHPSELYFPASPLFLEVGDQDTVPNHCTYEVPGFEGTRQIQVDEVLRREGIAAADSPYRITVHAGEEHNLIGSPVGASILDRLEQLALDL